MVKIVRHSVTNGSMQCFFNSATERSKYVDTKLQIARSIGLNSAPPHNFSLYGKVVISFASQIAACNTIDFRNHQCDAALRYENEKLLITRALI